MKHNALSLFGVDAPATVKDAAARIARHFLDAGVASAGVTLFDERREELETLVTLGLPDGVEELIPRLRHRDPLVARALTGAITVERDLFGSFAEWRSYVRKQDIPAAFADMVHPYAVLPLVDARGIVGVLQLNGHAPFTTSDLLAAATVSAQTSVCLAMLRARPRLESSSLFEALSPRELDLLQLLSQGHTNVDIAKALDISVDGVKKALQRLYRKLNVANRTEAIGLTFAPVRPNDVAT
jgi:DNA-binding CsgD family transcriptional regulator